MQEDRVERHLEAQEHGGEVGVEPAVVHLLGGILVVRQEAEVRAVAVRVVDGPCDPR